jgi:signal transduction histidine kinase
MNNISHEVRTPLNGILGFGELLTDPDVTDSQRAAYLSILHSSSDRLLKTINDYMDISLIVSGNLEVRPSLINADLLLGRIYSRFTDRALEKKLEIRLIKPEKASEILLDSDIELIEKVFNHLLDNAIKYSMEGIIELGYGLTGEDILFSVKDEGIGISEDKQLQIFEFFMQEDHSHTRKYDGSGLGLSIARGLVEILGGRIGVESHKGHGATFWFTIPLISN